MSIETRSSSALFKRAEQLKRWETSETNREPSHPREIDRKIKFSADCVYLAACAAGDKDEVIRLLQKGADINTGNVDGLTALHQACIDDDLDMVEFLVEQGADINRGDNEGWTPLHATASCGFISIAKYLIEQGCDLGAVNNDGQLALDIAESDEMEDMLQKFINEAGIDCKQARSEEERLMMNDARAWRGGAPGKDAIHPRTGASALHVAAAKGYLRVMSTLIQAYCDVNAQDFDGWTPLHGAAHWGQLEACKLLVENFCDMDMKNYSGQTAFDVADPDIIKDLEELRQKQLSNKKLPLASKKRVSTNNETNAVVAQEGGANIFEEETPNKVIKVELDIQSDKEDSGSATTNSDVEKKNRVNRDETASRLLPSSSPTEANKVPNQAPILPPKQQTENNEEGSIPSWRRSGSFRNRNQESDSMNSIATRIEDKDKEKTLSNKVPGSPHKVTTEPEVVLRRTHSFETDEKFYEQYMALRARIKASSCPTLHRCNPASPTHTNTATTTTRSASLRETHRRKEVKLNLELTRVQQQQQQQQQQKTGSNLPSPTSPPSKASTPISNSTSSLPALSTIASITNTTSPVPGNQIRSNRRQSMEPIYQTATTNSTTTTTTTPPTPTTPGGSKLSPGNIFKNFFKSFVPPVRDEESETQRKAHAKRVRETRRSTQGVTLDEIKSAEQLVKKKQQQQQQNQNQNQNQNQQNNDTTTISSSVVNQAANPVINQPAAAAVAAASLSNNSTSITATITTATPTTVSASKPSEEANLPERRPSWRLRVDNGSKFQLEDANNKQSTTNTTTGTTTTTTTATTTMTDTATTAYIRRPSGGTGTPRPSSAPVETIGSTTTADTTITLPLRRPLKPPEDKEQDKENDSRNAQATQAVIQRRRRPKRRSTGVVHVDMDEIDPERQDTTSSAVDYDDNKTNHSESGNERSGRSSRLGSVSSVSSDTANNPASIRTRGGSTTSENGEIDYKKLYEESQADNERLKDKLRRSDEQLKETKNLLDKAQNVQSKNSLSEAEKRERRAMERKLSEMEEELKMMEYMKCENQRLKDENGALIRVISKLSK